MDKTRLKSTHLSLIGRFKVHLKFTLHHYKLNHHVLSNMADLHLVLPALNLSTLNAGISIMM